MIDRKRFYDGIRHTPFPGKLTRRQVAGCEVILNEWEKRALKDEHWLAYMLATVFWETAQTMQPIRERGSKAYLRSRKYWPWIGRGYVQLTWKRNYRKFRARVLARFSFDIIETPDDATSPEVACFILFEGMLGGEFTGKKLADYFDGRRCDWINARRIINDTDRARIVAGVAKQFYADLVAASAADAKGVA